MTLSPPLADVLRLLFGPDRRRRAPVVFGRSPRQIARWCSGETRVPNWVSREIERRTLAAAANHEQWMPDRLLMERNRFSPDTLALLKEHGNNIALGNAGDGECIEIDLASGRRLGASDSRNDTGKAVGY